MDRELRITRAKELYEIYKTINDEILITFQYDNKLPKQINNSNFNSYNWLKDRIGFYPIWTLKLKPGLSFSLFQRQIDSTLAIDRPYVFFLKTNIEETIDTSLYNWVEVHHIENAYPVELFEDDYRIQGLYMNDWESFLAVNEDTEIIQTLVNPVKWKNEDIIKIHKQKDDNYKLRKMSFI